MATERPVRTRFAPSPSGHLHVGGARTALFNFAYAKRHGGAFILRIEDTDQKRSSDAAARAFMEDLHWLGVTWDEGPEYNGSGGGALGPYEQSNRLDIYKAHLDRLMTAGRAYRAFETPEELAAGRDAARQAKQNYRYDRASLDLGAATIDQYLAEGRPHVIRFRCPDFDAVTIHDHVRGDVRVDATEIDDFVICKADGYPTYHFAVVVDDELMQVSHVIRGAEHLYNTARHILLQDALGFRRPEYAHLSLIFNPDGSKMSKRDKDKALRQTVKAGNLTAPPPASQIDGDRWAWWLSSKDHQLELEESERLAQALGVHLPEINVDDFRRNGYLADVLINYLALLGWSPGGDVEKFDLPFLTEHFGFDRVVKSEARFDRDKLLAFNLDRIQAMSADEFTQQLSEFCRTHHPEFLDRLTPEQFRLVAESNQARSKTLLDPVESCRFFVLPDDQIEYQQSKAVRKALGGAEPNGYNRLEQLLLMFEQMSDWTAPAIEQHLHNFAAEHADGNFGKIGGPLRIAVTGGTTSPAIADTLAILGRESVIARITRCLKCREMLMSS